MRSLKIVLACSASVAGVCGGSVARAQDVPAQQASSQSSSESPTEIDDIVVTAQRRSERTQDIPVAISAFGGAQLERTGTVSLQSIATKVPSVYFGSFGALRPQLYIRGIGTRSFDPGSESSVGIFEDEVYLGRSSGSFGSIRDVERIEVLRGPQGTLYGRNTIGGAVNVITKAPTEDFHAELQGGISNFDGRDIFGAVSGPVLSDKITARISGWSTTRDGYIKSVTTGRRFQGIDNQGGRARLAIKPTDRLQVDLTAELTHDGNDGAFAGFNQGTVGNPGAVFFAPATRIPISTGSLRANYWTSDPTLKRNAQAYTARANYETGDVTLTSISAWRNLKVADSRDLDGSSLDVIHQNSRERSHQFTQEFRIASDKDGRLSLGGHLSWLIGAYYYNDRSRRQDDLRIGVDSLVRAALGTPALDTAVSDYRTKSYAVFGQATFAFTDHFDVTVGARYSEDKKSAAQVGTTTDALPIIAAPFNAFNKAKYTSFDPRIVATYKFNRDVSVYAGYSTGFKSGGFQYSPFSLAQANQVFQPEDLTAYEFGLKSDWFDRRLRINLAGFYYDYKNLQVSRIVQTGTTTSSLISNAASSTLKGVEIEIQAKPTRNIDLSATYGYLDAKYDRYIFNATTDFSDTRMVRAPKNTFSIGAEFHAPVAEGEVRLRADYAYTGVLYHEPGQGDIRFGTGVPLTREPANGLLDLSVSFERGPWSVTGYATNVTNESYRRTVNTLGSSVVGFAGQPRIYGLKLGVKM